MAIYPIYVANFLLVSCYTIALWLISITNRKLQGMRLLAWAYSAALFAGVIASISLPGFHWFTYAIAPELLLVGFTLLHYCYLNFVRRKPQRPWGWMALLLFGFAGFAYFGMDPQRYLERAVFTAALLGFQTGLSAYVLLRYSDRAIRIPARTMALVYASFTLRSVGRCLWILHYHIMPEQMPGWWQQISGVTAYVIINAFTPLGYLWMAATRLQDELESLSSTDSLTGALNRRAFDEKGNQEMERSQRYDLPMSVVAIDVDHFKELNDGFGHAGGDRVLVALADAMRSLLRSSDHLGRFGGDEFMLLLPATGLSGARDLAERLRERIDAIGVEFGGDCLEVHASFGVATLETARLGSPTGNSWEMLLQRADAALYRAKESGRNRVESAVDSAVLQ
ncbi:MAG TPA: GGDEF domain-containing protein [Acidobacteriaceae bacterium]|nr:GGDEF domain-containing protein [Acidobacteriaceae bacterium]